MSSMYTSQVNISEQSLATLTRTLKNAYKQIIQEINSATDFGVSNRRAILAQIETILTNSGEDVQSFLSAELPGYYEIGANDAIKQLKNVDAPISVATGFNKIHQDAIQYLVDDTTRAMFESLSGVKRSADLLLNKATRDLITQQIATGVISGENLTKMRQTIKGILAEQGLDSLTDKGGRGWSLDTYSEMLFRTKVVEARNHGFANRMVENGYDLAQVSSHSGACPLCEPWQGKIVSITGQTPGYPTLADAEADGLFHPNCRHAINALIPSLAAKTQAYDPETRTLTDPGATIKKPIFDQVKKATDKASDYDSQFKDRVKAIAQKAGYEFRGGPVKTAARATEKVIADYNGNIGELKDLNRGVIFIDDPNDLSSFVKLVEGEFSVDRVKDDFGDFVGYQKAMINVKLPTGTIGEIQVTTKEFWEAKKELGGDDLYHLVRVKADQWEEAEKKMQKLYEDAAAALEARLKDA